MARSVSLPISPHSPALEESDTRPPTRFTRGAVGYVLICVLIAVVIVLRGDGPHPRVVAIYPPPGDRYFPGGIAEITFSQAMNQSSVERALQVSPGAQGQGVWYGNTLNLQPVGDWRPNVTYHVRLTGSVTDTEGRPLHTPISFWFRVHHLGRLTLCPVNGIRTVCEKIRSALRSVFRSPRSVEAFALSPDGSLIAYTRRDASGLPHLFLIGADGRQGKRLTSGRRYADSRPAWAPGNTTSVQYERRRVTWSNGRPRLGSPHLWSIQIDGSGNAPL